MAGHRSGAALNELLSAPTESNPNLTQPYFSSISEDLRAVQQQQSGSYRFRVVENSPAPSQSIRTASSAPTPNGPVPARRPASNVSPIPTATTSYQRKPNVGHSISSAGATVAIPSTSGQPAILPAVFSAGTIPSSSTASAVVRNGDIRGGGRFVHQTVAHPQIPQQQGIRVTTGTVPTVNGGSSIIIIGPPLNAQMAQVAMPTVLSSQPAVISATGPTTLAIQAATMPANVVRPASGGSAAASIAVSAATPVSYSIQQPQSPSSSSTAASSPAPSTPSSLSSLTRDHEIQHPVNFDQIVPKAVKFLTTVMDLVRKKAATPDAEERLRILIQQLIDGRIDPGQFTQELCGILKSQPQQNLQPFLEKSLSMVRQALVEGRVKLPGINPPYQYVRQPERPPVGSGMAQVQQPINNQYLMKQLTNPPPGSTLLTSVPSTSQQPQQQQQPWAHTAYAQSQQQHAGPYQHPQNHRMPMPSSGANQSLGGGANQPYGGSANQSLGGGANQSPMYSVGQGASAMPKVVHQQQPIRHQAFAATPDRSMHQTGEPSSDDLNDVALMGDVNLHEEAQKLMAAASIESISQETKSVSDTYLLNLEALRQRAATVLRRVSLGEPGLEVHQLISHACEERLRDLLEKMAVIAEHRMEPLRMNPLYQQTSDVRGQVKFLEELGRVEQRRKEDREKEMLIKAAKSRAKADDPDVKRKAKELQLREQEELQNRDANAAAQAALQSIFKRPRLDESPAATAGNPSPATHQAPIGGASSSSGAAASNPLYRPLTGGNLSTQTMRPRTKRVNLRDFTFVVSQEPDLCRSRMAYANLYKTST